MEPVPNDVYIFPFFSVFKQELTWIFLTAIANLLCRAEAWDGRDVRKRKTKQNKRSSCFCVPRHRKKQSRPVKGRGRGELGDKEQMKCDEGTEKQICEKYYEGNAKWEQ